MLRYFVRRVLLALPTLFVISLITFGLNKCAPVDPVREIYGADLAPTLDPEAQAAAYHNHAMLLGLDKPPFYFSLTTAVFPDTLYRVFPPERRQRLAALTAGCGDWPAVSRYESQLAHAVRVMEKLPDTLLQKPALQVVLSNLLSPQPNEQLAPIAQQLETLTDSLRRIAPGAAVSFDSLLTSMPALLRARPKQYFPAPVFYWHGIDNQYHNWLSGFASGNLGKSFKTKNPVWDDLYWYVCPTLLINGVAILLAYLLAVPLGVAMARRRKRFDTWSRRGLLLLYAMPAFWLGSLLILFLATPDFGANWIDGIYLKPWYGSRLSFIEWSMANASKFILPVLTLSAHALTVLAIQMRGGMLDVMKQDFIRTALAKGVDGDKVYWRHAFRNALFPIITIFGSVFPAVFAGSLAVEYLFQFPGMGMKTQQAFMDRDHPVLFAILMFSAVLTILGNLVADLLFAWADPRVRFGRGQV